MASYNLNLIPGDAPVVVPVNQYATMAIRSSHWLAIRL